MAVDKAHKETDTILYKLERALQKEYSLEFAKLKKVIRESVGDMNIDKSLTPIERYNQAQKYKRLEKIEEEIATSLNKLNRQAVQEVNKNLTNVYKVNYTDSIDTLSVLLAVTIPNRYAKTPTNKEVNQVKQEEESPFDILALDDVRDIADLRKNITRQFTTSIMRGEDTNKLIERIQQVTQAKLSDIVRIARTQTTRLENKARIDAYSVGDKMGYTMVKEWVAVNDDRTRPAHRHANGQQVLLDQPFNVGGEELMYPGDSNGSAGNVINCRCTMRAGIKKK